MSTYRTAAGSTVQFLPSDTGMVKFLIIERGICDHAMLTVDDERTTLLWRCDTCNAAGAAGLVAE